MRVHERGSGETRSCGTGACAVAAAAAALPETAAGAPAEAGKVAEDDVSEGTSGATSRHFSGGASSRGESWRVDVPGGTVTVTLTAEGTALLTGPAVLVAIGEVERSVIWGSGG